MFSRPKVLLIHSDDAKSGILETILSENVNLHRARDPWNLKRILELGSYDAVFCGWSFNGGTWKDALQQIQQRLPDVPVIVFCHAGGEDEWVQVLEAGAFDLMTAPYGKRNVLSVLEHAVSSYEGRCSRNAPVYAEQKAS